jgi:site-specific DNA recombinase
LNSRKSSILGDIGMKLVGYIRVSTQDQAENTSLADQRKKIKSYCIAMGHELIEVFEEVGSGKNTIDRPLFTQALEAVRYRADGIVAAKLDRVARNTRDVLELVEDVLQPEKKALILLDLQVDTSTPMGTLILTVMAAVATLERSVINQRTQGGRKSKAENGGYAYGAPRFGEKPNGNKELVEDSDEQVTIEVIRRHRRSGKSYGEVADYLNEQEYSTKRGGKWSSSTVFAICRRLKVS